ncbi:hypothetical protein STCU_10737 [Strigomonas culicis]|uniref:Uncharacterized protein n=1 Tax=Strigomonas culicis TaxID=28005 RepID=S9V341_9TRYP|nr:hypothetical protein STCU_10737 [Strigomonas culicis]|eukprot:EPY17240.1 hypothetical protein STCU_10737 [Strigomonas culicis]
MVVRGDARRQPVGEAHQLVGDGCTAAVVRRRPPQEQHPLPAIDRRRRWRHRHGGHTLLEVRCGLLEEVPVVVDQGLWGARQ